MRNLLILFLLLLGGCATADITGHDGINLDEKSWNDRILQAEYVCAGIGRVVGTIEYDKCLDDQLKAEPAALKAYLDMLRARFSKQMADGTLDADRQCSNLGYGKGSSEYSLCLEYAIENSKNGASKKKK